MNFLADESVDGPIVERLRADNHSVVYMAELDPGLNDDVVLVRLAVASVPGSLIPPFASHREDALLS